MPQHHQLSIMPVYRTLLIVIIQICKPIIIIRNKFREYYESINNENEESWWCSLQNLHMNGSPYQIMKKNHIKNHQKSVHQKKTKKQNVFLLKFIQNVVRFTVRLLFGMFQQLRLSGNLNFEINSPLLLLIFILANYYRDK